MSTLNDQTTGVFVLHDAELLTEAGLSRHLGVERAQWLPVLVKELLDNALDACETHRVDTPEIQVEVTETTFSVAHNGPGQDEEAIGAIVFSTTEEGKEPLFFGPSRGQSGKTFKAILAALLVLHGERGHMQIESLGNLHAFEIRRLGNADCAYLAYNMHESAITTGTRISFSYPQSARPFFIADGDGDAPVITLVDRMIAFNPFVRVLFHQPPNNWLLGLGQDHPWEKWRRHDGSSPHCYSHEQFQQFVDALMRRNPELTVGDFIDRFHGLADASFWGSALGTTDLWEDTRLSELYANATTDKFVIERLLMIMKRDAPAVAPHELGIIGKHHFYEWLREQSEDLLEESLDYVCFTGVDEARVPFVLEVAFGCTLNGAREINAGINFTCCLDDSIPALNKMLDAYAVHESAPVQLIVHIVSPRMRHADRGKTCFSLPDSVMRSLNEAVGLIAAQWLASQRRTLGCPASSVV